MASVGGGKMLEHGLQIADRILARCGWASSISPAAAMAEAGQELVERLRRGHALQEQRPARPSCLAPSRAVSVSASSSPARIHEAARAWLPGGRRPGRQRTRAAATAGRSHRARRLQRCVQASQSARHRSAHPAHAPRSRSHVFEPGGQSGPRNFAGSAAGRHACCVPRATCPRDWPAAS